MKNPLSMSFVAVALTSVFAFPSPLRSEMISKRASEWRKHGSTAQLDALAAAIDAPATFYVSTAGQDDWSGQSVVPSADQTDGPFRTFQRAKYAVREYRKSTMFDPKQPTMICVEPGVYELTEPLVLTQEDSGTPESPVIWFASKKVPGEVVRLSGGCSLPQGVPVTDESVRDRLKSEVRDRVLEVNLKSLGLSDFGSAAGDGAELFIGDSPMVLARYPNEGFIKITGLQTEKTTEQDIRGTKGILEGFIQFDAPEFFTWSDEPDVWVNGYWFWDWANQRHKVASLDPDKKMLEVEPPYHGYGYRVGQWFYAYNVLRELDVTCECYIDRENGMLYFIPPVGEENATPLLTVIPSIIRMVNTSDVMMSGFVLDGCRQTAIDIQAGKNNLVAGCTIKNVGGSGISANGFGHWFFGNHLYNLGRGGISITAGDRPSITAGESAVVNNRIHNYGRIQRMYAAGIGNHGVGNYVANNEITDAPHCAIMFGGNEHLFEFNSIGRVCLESNDAGAIYAGRDWTMRGNAVMNNHLYDITGFENNGCVGIYLDDMFASCYMIGNLFENVTRAAFIGGGRDNYIIGNIFIECKPALHIDARALGWAHYHADDWLKEATEKGTISGIKWNEPPYSTRYPELATILEGKPKAPEGNVVARNIAVGGTWDVNKRGQWQGASVENTARPYVTFEDNITEEDPLFVDGANKDYRLKPESPALKNGFEPIPFEKMGCLPHATRNTSP